MSVGMALSRRLAKLSWEDSRREVHAGEDSSIHIAMVKIVQIHAQIPRQEFVGAAGQLLLVSCSGSSPSSCNPEDLGEVELARCDSQRRSRATCFCYQKG